ncbi:MAG: M48 family metalloprotease [Burkholderiales bacterium]|nr:M48 family metalloprotease [Burkholderiales bacterium]
MPERLSKPELSTDEGGLWAMMDREETRLRRGGFLLRDAALRDYLTEIACKLGGPHCNDTRVAAVRTPWFNASMAPNGMMQVWSGLLLRMDNEAQLAAVMGHEIGHYLQRHSVARLRDIKARTAFMGVLAFAGGIGLIGQLAVLAGAFGYSREHESEADAIGLQLMRKAGYDAREAARVWQNLRDELSAGAGGDPARKSVLFATHPPTEERQRVLAELAGSAGGFLGEAGFAARIEPLMPDLVDDELRRAQYDESLVLFTRLSQRRPQRADLHFARGEALRLRAQGDDAGQALAEYRLALQLERPPPQTHRSVGLVHRLQGQRAEAAAAFDQYLQLAPEAPDAELIRSYLAELTS